MHYIRLLRPPSLVWGKQAVLNFVLTITTDLGESFLCPSAPEKLSVVLEVETQPADTDGLQAEDADNVDSLPRKKRKRSSSEEPDTNGDKPAQTSHAKKHFFRLESPVKQPSGKTPSLRWTLGMRVLKIDLHVPKEALACLSDPSVIRKRISFSTSNRSLSVMTAQHVTKGRHSIVPLWVDVPAVGKEFPHVALRRLHIGDNVCNGAVYIEVEEEIGESIARHIWDAGLATVAFLADACMVTGKRGEKDTSLTAALTRIFTKPGRLHILELGSGVGILGVGLANIVQHARDTETSTDDDVSILLTDLPEAEERAMANITRAKMRLPKQIKDDGEPFSNFRIGYENLAWDEGCKGSFGSKATDGQPWDLVILSDCTYNVDMLPALVQTLSALQSASASASSSSASLSVLLARKPRHSSEETLFELMSTEGWKLHAGSMVPLSILDGESEMLELYLYNK